MKNIFKILLVEDNEGDAELTIEALQDLAVKSQIEVINDGEQAISYLSNAGRLKDRKLPDLILLDLNLPKVDGKEVLLFVKNSEALKKIPVVVLTTSSLESDIAFAYNNHANCYMVKSGNLMEFNKAISALEAFWINSVTYANIN